KLGIAASFTAHNLVPFLGAYLLEAGYLPKVRLAPYNQIFQACLEPKQFLGADCNYALLLWRIEDHMLDELAAFSAGNMTALDRGLEKLDELLGMVQALRTGFSGTVILNIPPLPTHGPGHFSGLVAQQSPAAFHAAIARRLRAQTPSGV